MTVSPRPTPNTSYHQLLSVLCGLLTISFDGNEGVGIVHPKIPPRQMPGFKADSAVTSGQGTEQFIAQQSN